MSRNSDSEQNSTFDLDTLGVPPGVSHPCSYINDRMARERACRIDEVPNGFYFLMMNHGWRRSGPLFYKPACDECLACRPIRVEIEAFKPNRTQRRIMKRNQDIIVKALPPKPTKEKFDLFVRYQESRHEGSMCTQWEEFESFLYRSPLKTRELEFRIGEQLLGCSIIDLDTGIISAVYTWFDPDEEKRSPGSFSVLWLLEHGLKFQYKYLYLGYYIKDCKKMNYKTQFKPCQILGTDGEWYVPE